MRELNAVIYDLDGLIIDSEPFWRLAEVEVFNKIGVPLTEAMCAETVGLRIDEVIAYWHEQFNWALDFYPLEEIEEKILQKMEELISNRGKPMSGLQESISYFKDLRLPLAVASSSKFRLIECALSKLKIEHHFSVVASAQDCVQGKPHPEVYLNAARELRVPPEECVALEDSFNGIKAAKAAGMICVAVPEKKNASLNYSLADYVVGNLAELEKLQLF